MYFRCLIILSVFPFQALADDKTYFIDRLTADMVKYRDDKTQIDLNITAQYTDNHLYENDVNKQSSKQLTISPTIKAQYHNDKNFLQWGLWLSSSRLNIRSQDDTTDRLGVIKYNHKFLDKQSFVLTSAFVNQFLDRGTTLSKGQGNNLLEKDHRKSNFINIAHQLGNEDSNAVLTTLVGIRSTEYQNRIDVTEGLNLSAFYGVVDFQYSLSAKTYLTTKISVEDVDYKLSTQQHRLLSSALFGIKWHKTEFTHFALALGMLQMDFDDGRLTSKQDFKWDLKFRWSPIESVEISASSFRAIEENRQLENSYLISDTYGLNINYAISDRVNIKLKSSFDILDYYFEHSNEQEQGLSADLGLSYKFNKNMSFSLSYLYQELGSFSPLNEYEKNTLSLGVNFVI